MTKDDAQPLEADVQSRSAAPAVARSNALVDHHGGANLDLVVTHYYLARSADPDDPVRTEYQRMLAEWELREGTVTSAYFCENIAAAVVMTDRDCLFSVGDPYRRKEDLPLYNLITRADHLAKFIEGSLVERPRRAGIAEIYAIETNALACMDALAATPALPVEEARELRSVTCKKVETDLVRAEHDAHTAWQQRAQIAYLQGMGIGILGVVATVFAAALLLRPLLNAWPEIPFQMVFVPWAVLLGAIGAVLSVMQRLTRGHLRLRLDSSLTENRALGGFRPVIGSALGLAVLILVLGGLIPLQIPGSDPERSFFLAGVAFLAGFSERYAQDMIGVGMSTRPSAPDARNGQADAPASGSAAP